MRKFPHSVTLHGAPARALPFFRKLPQQPQFIAGLADLRKIANLQTGFMVYQTTAAVAIDEICDSVGRRDCMQCKMQFP